MKLKALVLFSLFTATSAFAQFFPGQFFPAQVNVQVLPGQIVAQVVNPQPVPVLCAGQVLGQVANGQVLNTYFQQVLPAGGFQLAYLQSAFIPFVRGWANINCRVVGWGW